MIHKEATIKYKGYDPNNLPLHSNKRICMICEDCGRVRWGRKVDYHDLCFKCKMKSNEWKKNNTEAMKNVLKVKNIKE